MTDIERRRHAPVLKCLCGEYISSDVKNNLELTARHVIDKHPDQAPAFSRWLQLMVETKMPMAEAEDAVAAEFPDSMFAAVRERKTKRKTKRR